MAQLVIGLLRGARGCAAVSGGPSAAAAAGVLAESGAGANAGVGSDAAGEGVMCEGAEGSEAAPLLEAHQLGVICFFRGQAGLIKQLIAAGGLWDVCRDVLHQMLVHMAHTLSANLVCPLLLFARRC